MRHVFFLAILLILGAILVSCDRGGSVEWREPPPGCEVQAIEIVPASAEVAPGAKLQFYAKVTTPCGVYAVPAPALP